MLGNVDVGGQGRVHGENRESGTSSDKSGKGKGQGEKIDDANSIIVHSTKGRKP